MTAGRHWPNTSMWGSNKSKPQARRHKLENDLWTDFPIKLILAGAKIQEAFVLVTAAQSLVASPSPGTDQ